MARSTPLEPQTAYAGIAPPRSVIFAAMSVPYYPHLWAIGLLWNLTRWMGMFLCSYLANHLTHSPFLVQMVGAALFAPLFFGGAVGGVIADRLDRRRTLLGVLSFLVPIGVLMAAINLAGVVETWMIYPYMLVIGGSMVLDMTSRRALVYELVGPEQVTNALALESLAMTCGSLLGSLSAGTVISVFGIGSAFAFIAVCYAVSLLLLLGVPSTGRPKSSAGPSILKDLGAGFRYVRRHRALISILGVTVIVNTFFFTYTPMIPVFAERLGVNAFWTGILASANALGMMLGTLLIARGLPIRRGLIYVGGSALAFVFLFVFAAVDWYPVAFFALVCAGSGVAGFSTMQSALVLTTADDDMRGRAMGMLSMGIGALPFAMLVLGAVAQAVGPATGVMASVVIGLAAMGLWSIYRPEVQRVP